VAISEQDGKNRAGASPAQTLRQMDLAAIKALPVPAVAAETAHLYLWVPNAMLPEGVQVLEAGASSIN
jgi:N6-adenosine-specific RNA methylase IME4